MNLANGYIRLFTYTSPTHIEYFLMNGLKYILSLRSEYRKFAGSSENYTSSFTIRRIVLSARFITKDVVTRRPRLALIYLSTCFVPESFWIFESLVLSSRLNIGDKTINFSDHVITLLSIRFGCKNVCNECRHSFFPHF